MRAIGVKFLKSRCEYDKSFICTCFMDKDNIIQD